LREKEERSDSFPVGHVKKVIEGRIQWGGRGKGKRRRPEEKEKKGGKKERLLPGIKPSITTSLKGAKKVSRKEGKEKRDPAPNPFSSITLPWC